MSQSRSSSTIRPAARLRAESTPLISKNESPPPSPARHEKRGDRTSFISIKEDDADIAQTFFDSKPTQPAETIADSSEDVHPPELNMISTLTVQEPPSCCPCRRWKQIRLRGRWMSRSFGDLRLLGTNYQQAPDWEGAVEVSPSPIEEETQPSEPSPVLSSLERLPTEIHDQIMSLLITETPSNGCAHRNTDLMACLLSSRTLHSVTLRTLYRHATFPHSLIFHKFLNQITQNSTLGSAVRRLDFSHFSSIGLGRTKRMNTEIQMLTASTLTACLDLTPRLREFLVQEHLEDDLDERVLGKLFHGLLFVTALDFCGCASPSFTSAFSKVISRSNPVLPSTLTLERLSLHECATLPAQTFYTLLARLPRLTHLDLCHTQVTASALSLIPDTARLTHLNLSRCTRLAGDQVVDFLVNHPAVKDSLVYLNLMADASRYRLLCADDVSKLLPRLPSTLRALNLSGAEIVSKHVPMLQPLMSHLEELSIGFGELSLAEIQSFYIPPPKPKVEESSPEEEANSEQREELDRSQQVTEPKPAEEVTEEPWCAPSLRYLDLTGVKALTTAMLFSSDCILLRPVTQPLEVIELGERVISDLRARGPTNKRVGWAVRELGRRGWYVREPSPETSAAEKDPGRPWKMGAMWWGMRKIPVAWNEVGGLYGHYMFKK
ncbi:MAG: hypothetical protein M1816_006949 [Peltula sp. TS41687]|nr:MAG: hypothetical protein M1816_006949 [Peltula sp. TS41687]